jgi:hypothetical protein
MKRVIPIIGIIVSLLALIYRVYLVQSAQEPFLSPGFSYELIVVGLVWAALGMALDYF